MNYSLFLHESSCAQCVILGSPAIVFAVRIISDGYDDSRSL